jgi:preprotein translocase subunit YajC
MTPLSSLIHASALLAASSSTKKSSSSSELPFIIIIGLFVVVYFFFLRPRQQKAKQAQQKGKSFDIGDEVMSVGGIYGTVVGLNDDSVDVRVAPDVVLTFLRRAVNPRPPSATGSSIPDDASGLDDDSDGDSTYDDNPYGGPSSFEDSGHFDDHEHPDGEYDADEDEADEVEADEVEAEDDETDAQDAESDASDEDEQGHGAGGSAPGHPRTTGGASSEDD